MPKSVRFDDDFEGDKLEYGILRDKFDNDDFEGDDFVSYRFGAWI